MLPFFPAVPALPLPVGPAARVSTPLLSQNGRCELPTWAWVGGTPAWGSERVAVLFAGEDTRACPDPGWRWRGHVIPHSCRGAGPRVFRRAQAVGAAALRLPRLLVGGTPAGGRACPGWRGSLRHLQPGVLGSRPGGPAALTAVQRVGALSLSLWAREGGRNDGGGQTSSACQVHPCESRARLERYFSFRRGGSRFLRP